MKSNFIITTFAEDHIGILYRILNVFSRKMINVESLTVVEADEKGFSKITFVIKATQDIVEKVTKQIDKQIGVTKTLFYANSSVMNQKISLYRLFTKTLDLHEELVPVDQSNQAFKTLR